MYTMTRIDRRADPLGLREVRTPWLAVPWAAMVVLALASTFWHDLPTTQDAATAADASTLAPMDGIVASSLGQTAASDLLPPTP